ncbi:MAG: DUF4476 domain-containing protein [Candidatus Cloacimonetes bacterium]|nr:DUF4476 domain-containing protein [Candidatus Cloacimonadota bacterium]
MFSISNTQNLKHSAKGLIMLLFSLMLLLGFSALWGEEISDKAMDNSKDSEAYERLPNNRQALLKKLTNRIDKLQMSYISQLYKGERFAAQKLLDEIRKIANDLAYTSLSESQIVVVNPSDAGSNITINVNPSAPMKSKIGAMQDKDFADLKLSIRKNNFGDGGLSTLKASTDGNYFRSAQIVELLPLFVFSKDKLKALEITYPKCIDASNKYKILDAFLFDADKKVALEIMDRLQK